MNDKWKNRRRMAWLSLLAGLLYPVLVLLTDSANIVGIAAHFYLFVGAIVSSYIGFATWDDRTKPKVEPDA